MSRDLDGPSVQLEVDWAHDSPSPLSEERGADLLAHGLSALGQCGAWGFAVRFVDDVEMCRLHERYLGDPSPTDIMTFPNDPDDGERGGDILISVDTAAANAAEHGWSTGDELQFLLLHGLLHVLGWDDSDAADRAAMLDRQHEILTSWRNAGQRRG